MYINTPQFENIFNNTEKQILLSNINENMLTRTDGNRNKLVKARANKLGMFFMEKLKYYRINDQTFEIIQNKFKTSPSSAGILVTEPNYKTLIHRGTFNESEEEHLKDLRELYLSLPVEQGKNTIVSAHNGVIREAMFDSSVLESDDMYKLEEGGFYVISSKDGKLILEHRFYSFKDFIITFYPREY